MATFTKFQDFKERLGKGEFDFANDTFKIALSNTAPDAATDALLADITQIAAGNGYVSGGPSLASPTWVETAGVGVFDAADLTIAASGGAIAGFRYVVVYDDTATGKPLIGYSDLGSTINLSDGESRQFVWSANGIVRVD